ncbi:uncharacterized protein DUF1488 [Rhizobium sp. BK251]|nr:uncharacterized protein DUF1488 [Rhizobium sp. BK251]
MTLLFPNRSRSFDDVRKVVRFLGYDGMFEVRFFVETTALPRTSTGMSETDYLRAFDAAPPIFRKPRRDFITPGAERPIRSRLRIWASL